MSAPETPLRSAIFAQNPAWVQLLGLCPLMAVSNNIANAAALAAASLFVVVGSNTLVAALRHQIPDYARLMVLVLVIATFTTITTLVLEAFAYAVYIEIALFVQIIVTNCMILGRAEAFAMRNTIWNSFKDGLGTGIGFAIALLCLGALREWLTPVFPLAQYPPGAFILAGLSLALAYPLLPKRDT